MPTHNLKPRTPPRRRRHRSRSGSRDKTREDTSRLADAEDSDGPSTTDIGTTDDEASDRGPTKKVELLVNADKKKRWESWWRRFWWTLAMIGGFFGLLFLLRQTGLVLMVVMLQANIYRELVSLAIRETKERQLPGFSAFYVYWFFVGLFFMYGLVLMKHFRYHDMGYFTWVLDHHYALAWAMYIIGLMAFVTSLKKRKLYRYQFKQFAFCHTAIVAVVFQSTLLASNVFQGLIWFVLPSGMVVCNDCFAYIFGFFFGKTPLIRLSPKKTWEGFLGGFLATVVWAFWFARLIQSYEFFTCPKVGFGLDLSDCNSDSILFAGVYKLHPLSAFVSPSFAAVLPAWLAQFQLSSLQIHSIVMAVFASFCAPFGGFFASGFKRAFKIKDFGNVIPGHGGFTDRMDCQIIMGLFVYVYFHNVIAFGGYEIESSLSKVLSLPYDQQVVLLQRLASHLGYTVAPV